MSKAVQLDAYCRGWRGRPYVKRQTSRAMRRDAKRNPEDAGKNRRGYIRGWAS